MYNKDKHNCPRGFHWCDEKEECIPERSGVEDKLMLKAERYFFKEQQSCPNGFVWCPNTKKCIPAAAQKSKGQGKGKGFGQGKGPVGVPKKEDIDMLVDEVFDGGFAQFGKTMRVEKQVDQILDYIVNEVDLGKGSITTGRPYDHPIKTKVVTTVDGEEKTNVGECGGPMGMQSEEEFEDSEYDGGPAKADDPRKHSNAINQVPNQNMSKLIKSLYDEISEAQILKTIAELRINENYKKYFKLMLKKHGYNSPADIPADKKKDFFNAIDKGWKGVKEQDISESVRLKLKVLEEAGDDVTLNTIIMKYGIRASKMYNSCMAKAKSNPIFSKNRRLAKATCRYNDYMYNVKQLKAHVGMCAQAKNPEKCKKHVAQAIKFDVAVAAGHAETVKKLKAKMKK